MIRSIPAALALLAASLAVTTAAPAAQRAVMKTGGKAFAPPAFYDFCSAHRSLCSTGGGARVVELTERRRAELEKVNRSVNARLRERSDPAGGDGADRWRLSSTEGDCEEFAILKKAELLKRGWPASALLLTVGTAWGRGHTVLTVRTSEGDLILDNYKSAIKPWSKTSYRYFARQAPGSGRKWERILGAAE
ncbi:MAG TPA: transglutaminase-like cysteine peptidase [Mesorhizobium sp.]|jgi:predicted transglutaminase-like cysteine proteinase|nr:transglutaminase-like cysteine peptidase [Mesorhizobium sp.]